MGLDLGPQQSHIRTELMRSLAKKIPSNGRRHGLCELVELVYKGMESKYGVKAHEDNFSKDSKRLSLKIGYSEEQLENMLYGLNHHIPWDILKQKNWRERIQIFEGLGNYEKGIGPARYFIVPQAHLNSHTLDQILEPLERRCSVNGSLYGIKNEVIEDPSKKRKYIDRFLRSDCQSHDLESYLRNNKGKLFNGKGIRKRHTKTEKVIMKRLISEGYEVFPEVDIRTSQKQITRLDVVGIKYGSFVVYDAKIATGLQTSFPNTEANLREAAEFLYYNFGMMPELKIQKKYPAPSISVSLPAVNKLYSGIFSKSS
jgi:hypothetical protein